MTTFTCRDRWSNILSTSNINDCYCGDKNECPNSYSNGETYNSKSCCIKSYCKDPSSDVCRILYSESGFTIGTIFFCSFMVFIFLFCFHRRQHLRDTMNSTQNARRPELMELGGTEKPAKRWEVEYDDKNRVYYVDHWNQRSTWIKPAELKSLEKNKSGTEPSSLL